MRYLLDTSILSIFAPRRTELTTQLRDWVFSAEQRLYVPVIGIAELRQGVAKLRRNKADRRADEYEDWLAQLLHHYAERILSVDQTVAFAAGEMVDAALARGRPIDFGDLYIAATARVHNLTVLTHNARHFEVTGVAYLDPLVTLPR